MSVFLNLTNHPSSKWNEKQLAAAKEYGKVIDIPFPIIDPYADSAEIDRVVDEYFSKIIDYDSPTVLIQGEFTFTYRMVARLKKNGIMAVTACSVRQSSEVVDADGVTNKIIKFDFITFREY